MPRYLLRDCDRIFGQEFVKQVTAMGIEQVLSAPRSPWQRAYIERVIGTIRRECLDHLIVFNECSLHRHLQAFVDYYHRHRVHLALAKDTPEPDRSSRSVAGSCRYLCWAGCIIDTSGAPRKSSTQMMPLSANGVPYDGNALPPT